MSKRITIFLYVFIIILMCLHCVDIVIDKDTPSVSNLSQIQEEDNKYPDTNSEIIDYYINIYSSKYKVDRALAHAVATIESRKNPYACSKTGAYGIMQLTPQTAKHLGVNVYDTESNIEGGIKYLAYLDKKFNGDIDLVLAGYNAGPSNVVKYKGVPPFSETQKYVKKVKCEKARIDS